MSLTATRLSRVTMYVTASAMSSGRQFHHAGGLAVERFAELGSQSVAYLGVDRAGRDDADPNSLAQQLLSQTLAKRVDSELRQRVDGGARSRHQTAVELTVTTSATPRAESAAASMRCGSAARVAYSTPKTLTDTRSSRSAVLGDLAHAHQPRVVDQNVESASVLSCRPIAAPTDSGSVTSAGTARTRPPSALILAATSSRRSTRRASSATAAPCRARATAVAAPMPLLAPVHHGDGFGECLGGQCPSSLTRRALSADDVAKHVRVVLARSGAPCSIRAS